MKSPVRDIRTSQVVLNFTVSIIIVAGLLVSWILYVIHSATLINEMTSKLAPSHLNYNSDNFHWFVLAGGCLLFVSLIVALSIQLAQRLSEKRYVQKQEEFISNITHEMKSPLAAIKLHAQTLQDPTLPATHRAQFTHLIEQQSDRMQRLVENVLEMSRIQASTSPLELHHLALSEMLQRLLPEFKESAENLKLKLRTNIPGRGIVLSHPMHVERILKNLLENAFRFSEPGGTVHVSVIDTVVKGKDSVQLIVEDEGVGIPKDELPKIFERFYQVRRDDARQKGTGLGLSIVKGLITEMKGTIEAQSIPDIPKGTRFVMTFPRLKEYPVRMSSVQHEAHT